MTNVESSPEINGLGDYMQKVFIWNVNMQLTGRGMNQQALCAPLGLKKGAVSAKMTGKTTWTIQDIAGVPQRLAPLSSGCDDVRADDARNERRRRCIFGGSGHRRVSCAPV